MKVLARLNRATVAGSGNKPVSDKLKKMFEKLQDMPFSDFCEGDITCKEFADVCREQISESDDDADFIAVWTQLLNAVMKEMK